MMDDLAGAVERLKAWAEHFDRIYLRHGGEPGTEAEEYGPLAADLATAITAMEQVQGFWLEVSRRWHIEDRAYFESEAQRAGFGSPMMMALHHVWKRDPKVAPIEAERDAAQERLRELREWLVQITSKSQKLMEQYPEGDIEWRWPHFALVYGLQEAIAKLDSLSPAPTTPKEPSDA